MRIAFSLLLLIREEYSDKLRDITMIRNCIKSLGRDDNAIFVVYNQGVFSNNAIEELLKTYNINYDIIGSQINVGIPIARQKTFEHIWSNYPEVKYICELHSDMIFYKEWYRPLIAYLEENKNEPMISPGIINGNGEYIMKSGEKIHIPNTLDKAMELIESLKIDRIVDGLVHPAIHNVQALKEIGGIDLRFFKGKQGYEDYSILIGYAYYIGVRYKWRPKINGNSTVIHFVAAQRWKLEGANYEIAFNEEGLFQQYGAYGMKILSEMLNDNDFMGKRYSERVNTFINSTLSIAKE